MRNRVTANRVGGDNDICGKKMDSLLFIILASLIIGLCVSALTAGFWSICTYSSQNASEIYNNLSQTTENFTAHVIQTYIFCT